ncbi:hypothetical protein V5F53_02720 [Xanthobacter sp. V4C-4]|uniref:hypothetical protein n=1 Tax=Xanthobacter cornucopiae TaxID=3119924 RepID=UPI00372C1A08
MSSVNKKTTENWNPLFNKTAFIEIASNTGLWYLYIQPEFQGLHETGCYFWTATLNPWGEPPDGGDDGAGFFTVQYGLEDDMQAAMRAAKTVVSRFDAANDDNVIPFN